MLFPGHGPLQQSGVSLSDWTCREVLLDAIKMGLDWIAGAGSPERCQGAESPARAVGGQTFLMANRSARWAAFP